MYITSIIIIYIYIHVVIILSLLIDVFLIKRTTERYFSTIVNINIF